MTVLREPQQPSDTKIAANRRRDSELEKRTRQISLILSNNRSVKPTLLAYAHFGYQIRNQREFSPLYSTR